MTARGCEVFVYYRVPTAETAGAAAEVLAAQQQLMQQVPGLAARLLRKTEDRGEAALHAVTWMEIYQHPQGIDADQLARLRARMQSLPTGRIGERHEERFEPHP